MCSPIAARRNTTGAFGRQSVGPVPAGDAVNSQAVSQIVLTTMRRDPRTWMASVAPSPSAA